MDNQTTRWLTLGGVLGALTLIDLWLAAALPTMKLVLYTLSSLPMIVMVLETNKRSALIFYGATAALALLILPNTPLSALPYVLLLGLYGLVKAVAERMPSTVVEWVIKLVYCNVMTGLWYLLIVKLLLPDIVWPLPVGLLAVLAQVAFIGGDFVYSAAVWYYAKKIRPKLKF